MIKVAWSPRLRSKLHMGTDNSEDHQYFDVNHQHFYVHHQHFHVNQLPQTSKITRRTCERALQDGFRLFLGGGITPAGQPVDWSFPPRSSGGGGTVCARPSHSRFGEGAAVESALSSESASRTPRGFPSVGSACLAGATRVYTPSRLPNAISERISGED